MDKFKILQELGAGEFQHLNGSLEAHLKGTQSLLHHWGASDVLQTAGLFHAAYGTAGFDDSMVSLGQRRHIAQIIGQQEEALVYLYCSCDRDFVFPQFGQTDKIQFKDRFNGKSFLLEEAMAKLFCELTVANELELVSSSEAFKLRCGAQLLNLFQKMDGYLSIEARDAYHQALSSFQKR